MKRFARRRRWLSLFFLVPIRCCLADPALPASVTFSEDASVPLYDLTGSYQFNQTFTGPGGAQSPLSAGLAIQEDATGRLQGSGSTTILVGDVSYPATFRVAGRMGGGGFSTHADLVARWQFQDSSGASGGPFTISIQYALNVTPAGLSGTAHGVAKLPVAGKGKIRSVISPAPLPPGVDGTWSVQMSLLPVKGIAGTGAILLPNGRSLNGRLAGSASTPIKAARVKFSGTQTDRGAVLSVDLSGSSAVPQRLSGRILGQTVSQKTASQGYVGSQACIECHGALHQTVMSSFHAQVGVQCEDCHGPAAAHAANYYDPTTRPKIDLGGGMCKACHSGAQHPVFEEWNTSAHAQGIVDVSSADQISSCGRCHSGAVRESLLDNAPLPVAASANAPIGCPVCHEPHETTPNPFLLRNPVASTNDYFMATNDVFSAKYDPNVNLCAQCHNHRGASWADSSAPPHPSPQYNMLLGTVGELDSGLPHYQPAAHALLINQCASCHMQTAPSQGPGQPAISGHTFTVDVFDVCLPCHPSPEGLISLTSMAVSNQIQQVKFELDYWATNNAPPALAAKYGTRAWEYTSPGELSPGGPGPDAVEQAQIPMTIQKARFDLYLILRDGSFGVHNPPYTVDLLDTAQGWVEGELNP